MLHEFVACVVKYCTDLLHGVLDILSMAHDFQCCPPSTGNRYLSNIRKYISFDVDISRDAGKIVGQGADRSKRAPTTLGQQIYPRNGGHPRHFFGNIIGYASHSHINDCLFQLAIGSC